MINIFSSKNPKVYNHVRKLLAENGIQQYNLEDYLSSIKYTSYDIYINEEDYERSTELLNRIREEKIYYYENFDFASTIVIIMVLAGILAEIWINSY